MNEPGFSTATGVEVTDVLPAGLTYVSSSASQGSYNSGSGVWTIGTIPAGGTATLSITATVTTLGTKVQTAEVSRANEPDTDSTPGNGVPTEDDRDSAAVEPQQPVTAQVGNFVWTDLNTNGLQDAGELGRDGVTVNLYRDTNGNGTSRTGRRRRRGGLHDGHGRRRVVPVHGSGGGELLRPVPAAVRAVDHHARRGRQRHDRQRCGPGHGPDGRVPLGGGPERSEMGRGPAADRSVPDQDREQCDAVRSGRM